MTKGAPRQIRHSLLFLFIFTMMFSVGVPAGGYQSIQIWPNLEATAFVIDSRQQWYVSLQAPAGGDGSRDHPFQQITQAVQAATAYKNSHPDEAQVIHVAPGVYGKVFVSIDDLTIAGDFGEGIQLGDVVISAASQESQNEYALYLSEVKNVRIQDLAFTNARAGIFAYESDGCVFDSNLFFVCADGVYFYGTENSVIKNSVFQARDMGINFWRGCYGNYILNNEIEGATWGIAMASGANSNFITDNTISLCDEAGIRNGSAYNNVYERNVIFSNGRQGIDLIGNFGKIRIVQNEIHDNPIGINMAPSTPPTEITLTQNNLYNNANYNIASNIAFDAPYNYYGTTNPARIAQKNSANVSHLPFRFGPAPLTGSPYSARPSVISGKTASSSGIALEWTIPNQLVNGEPLPPGMGVTYTVYRSLEGDSWPPSGDIQDSAITLVAEGLSAPAYLDKAVQGGVTYHYIVTSRIGANESWVSEEVFITAVDVLNVWHVAAGASNGGDGSQSLPFARIQEALSVACEGDLIKIFPGTYREEVFVAKDGIAVTGVDEDWGDQDVDPSRIVIDIDNEELELRETALRYAYGIHLDHVSDVSVRNLSVRDAGYGVFVSGGGNNRLENVRAVSNAVYGIRIQGSSGMRVMDCEISGNGAESKIPLVRICGIYASQSDDLLIENTVASHNANGNQMGPGGGGIYLTGCGDGDDEDSFGAILKNNRIERNGHGYVRGLFKDVFGAFLNNCPDALVSGNILSYNGGTSMLQYGEVLGSDLVLIGSDRAFLEQNSIFSTSRAGVYLESLEGFGMERNLIMGSQRCVELSGTARADEIILNMFNPNDNTPETIQALTAGVHVSNGGSLQKLCHNNFQMDLNEKAVVNEGEIMNAEYNYYGIESPSMIAWAMEGVESDSWIPYSLEMIEINAEKPYGPSFPLDLVVEKYSDRTELSWEPPMRTSDGSPIPQDVSLVYHVYRYSCEQRIDPYNPATLVYVRNTTRLAENLEQTTYVDSGLQVGGLYYYFVTVLMMEGDHLIESWASNIEEQFFNGDLTPAVLTVVLNAQDRPDTAWAGVAVSLVGPETYTVVMEGSGNVALFDTAAEGTYRLEVRDPHGLFWSSGPITVSSFGVSSSPGIRPVIILGDANQDGVINDFDRSIVVGSYGATPPDDPRADITNDGTVDMKDLNAAAENYGRSGSAP